MGYRPAIPSISSTALLYTVLKITLVLVFFFQGIAVAQEIIKVTDLDSDMSAFSTSM